jgi:hypothetical protein
MDSAARDRQTVSAHNAVRGTKKTFLSLCAGAITRQAIPTNNVSSYEVLLADLLRQRGLITIPQFAIGPYSCDLAINGIAMEV